MEKIDITIIGAGVIGLSVAFELSKFYQDIFVIEKILHSVRRQVQEIVR